MAMSGYSNNMITKSLVKIDESYSTPFQMDQSPTANVRNAVVCDCEKENAHVYDGL